MRIQITSGGIYGAQGEIPIGTKLTVEHAPAGWEGRYIDLDKLDSEPKNDDTDALKARVTELEGVVKAKDGEIDALKAEIKKTGEQPKSNDAPIKAEHHGGGKFKITQGESVLASGLSKADADAFNALSDDEKAEYVKSKAA